MRKMFVAGALGALMLGGCISTPDVSGSRGAPSLAALQSMCGTTAVDYGTDAQGVYSALFDAYVAQKRGKLPKEQFCAFQAGIAGRYTAFAASRTTEAQSAWATFFADQRAQALSWRSAVDPTLRAG
ncbi:hypothetical protein EOS_29860 [Caballeronia mineralivorans PML1(12)]|uniref:Lipoprotein n=1 Tax=Caballeronia mineralivorans PML1(12) TaxID=908627 RepID=A0A0J1CQE8_9BURK|nr:hypothetical protein [Caballeronia mineralivorans]KLU22541.1 hypothetical protein EOS_29860 [Caballeronia mineralivorans PML1(12)]